MVDWENGQIANLTDNAFRNGRDAALGALNLTDEAISEECPWSFERIIDEDFLPGAERSD
jgi:hypothetical protein